MKANYTVVERHEIYKKALQILKDQRVLNPRYGLCSAIFQATDHRYPLIENMPEMLAFKPRIKMAIRWFFNIDTWDYPRLYWFPLTEEGYNKRVQILEKCIKMTQP